MADDSMGAVTTSLVDSSKLVEEGNIAVFQDAKGNKTRITFFSIAKNRRIKK